MRKNDVYITKTPQEEIDICEACPFPKPKCKDKGCDWFIEQKRKLKEKEEKKVCRT